MLNLKELNDELLMYVIPSRHFVNFEQPAPVSFQITASFSDHRTSKDENILILISFN